MLETHYFLITLQHFTITYSAEYIYVCYIHRVETLYNGESLYGHTDILHFINTIKQVEVGRLSYKVPAFLN